MWMGIFSIASNRKTYIKFMDLFIIYNVALAIYCLRTNLSPRSTIIKCHAKIYLNAKNAIIT